ncbi:MAG: hypothetical protein PHE84_04065 [bacterium]|nr:hypothetical protein [bacterium]
MFGADLPEAWVSYADRNYLITRLIWFTGFLLDAPVSSHRTIELYLKAFLVSRGEPVGKNKTVWGHDLENLLESCIKYNQDFSVPDFVRRVKYFQRYFDFIRYPTDLKLPDEKSMIWFSIDSCIFPLDEIVAFIRPRIKLTEDEWKKTWLNSIFSSDDPKFGFQKRALTDSNNHLKVLICGQTNNSSILFDHKFSCDLPGC